MISRKPSPPTIMYAPSLSVIYYVTTLPTKDKCFLTIQEQNILNWKIMSYFTKQKPITLTINRGKYFPEGPK